MVHVWCVLSLLLLKTLMMTAVSSLHGIITAQMKINQLQNFLKYAVNSKSVMSIMATVRETSFETKSKFYKVVKISKFVIY